MPLLFRDKCGAVYDRASADLIGTGRVTVMKLGLVDAVRVCPLRCGSRPEYVYSGPFCEG